MTSDIKLRRMYRWVNTNWFGGALPDDVVVWWESCQDAAAITAPIDGVPGEVPQLGIRFDPCLAGLRRYTKQVMAHECIHVKLWGERGLTDHGVRFDKEMQRLCGLKSYRCKL